MAASAQLNMGIDGSIRQWANEYIQNNARAFMHSLTLTAAFESLATTSKELLSVAVDDMIDVLTLRLSYARTAGYNHARMIVRNQISMILGLYHVWVFPTLSGMMGSAYQNNEMRYHAEVALSALRCHIKSLGVTNDEADCAVRRYIDHIALLPDYSSQDTCMQRARTLSNMLEDRIMEKCLQADENTSIPAQFIMTLHIDAPNGNTELLSQQVFHELMNQIYSVYFEISIAERYIDSVHEEGDIFMFAGTPCSPPSREHPYNNVEIDNGMVPHWHKEVWTPVSRESTPELQLADAPRRNRTVAPRAAVLPPNWTLDDEMGD